MTSVSHYSRGYLPHHQESGAVVAITFRLADSLPLHVQCRIEDQVRHLAEDKRNQAIANLTHSALDRGLGKCWLRRPDVAELMQDTLRHFDGERYRLVAWVVMPNHVHVVIQPTEVFTLAGIVRSWKGYTARMANRLLGREGAFFQRDFFDRQIRNDQHLLNAIEYIHNNPVKAGLVGLPRDWKFSSALAYESGALNITGLL